MRANLEIFINVIKVVVACTIAVLIGYWFKLSVPQWLLISVIVVMSNQIYLGSTLNKSYLRLAGTVIGAIAAVLSIFLLSQHLLIIKIAMLFLIGICVYFTQIGENYAYMSMLAAVTVAVALGTPTPNFTYAISRALELITGVVIAILVSRFIFPIRAKKKIKNLILATLNNLQSLHLLFISKPLEQSDMTEQEELEGKIIKLFTQQSTLIKESLLESKKARLEEPYYKQILFSERKLFRSFYMLRQALTFENVHNAHIIKINGVIQDVLQKLSQELVKNSLSEDNTFCQQISDEIKLFIHENIKNDNIVNYYAIIFCLQHIAELLDQLGKQILNPYSNNCHNHKP